MNNSHFLIFISILFTSFLSSHSFSAEDKLANYKFTGGEISVFEKDGHCFASIDGKFQNNIETIFSQAINDINSRQCQKKIILLTSKGGNLEIAMRMGKIIRSGNMITQVHEECDSACSLVFVGGVERLVDVETSQTLPTKFLIHQPAVPTISGINRCVTDFVVGNPFTVRIKSYLLSMLSDLAALNLYKAMMEVSCDSEKNINPTTLLDFKIATGTGYLVTEIDSQKATSLINQNGCFSCHSLDKDKNGPAFSKVGKFYRGKPDAYQRIINRLVSGDKARFPDEKERPHPIVKTSPPDDRAQIENLANWILGQ
jgi:cytochrome c